MTTAERPARTVYTCQRCGKPVDSRQVHVKTVQHIERERHGVRGLVITVQASEVVSVTHLARCAPAPKEN